MIATSGTGAPFGSNAHGQTRGHPSDEPALPQVAPRSGRASFGTLPTEGVRCSPQRCSTIRATTADQKDPAVFASTARRTLMQGTFQPRRPRIAAVGLASWDRIIRVERYPVPGSYAIVQDSASLPGGTTSNSAVTIARLGADVAIAALIGDDPEGNALRDTLRR